MPRKYNPLLDEKLDYYETNAPGGGITNVNISAGTTSQNLSRFVFSNSNNVSFGLNGSTITASVPTQTAFVFSNSNGVTFGTNGSTVTASVQTNYLTTAALSNHSHNFATTTTNGALIVVGTTNSNGATIGVPPYLTTAQPVGAYLTTARASNDAVGLNTAATNVTWTVNSSGISLNAGAYLTTAMASNRGSDFVQANAVFAGTNASGTIASNGISVSVAPPGAGGGVAISGGANSQGTGTVNFANSNGITFGLSNNGTMTASHNGLTTARASNDGVGLNTAGTNVTWTVNSSGISFNGAGYAGTGTSATNASVTLNSNGLAISVAAPGGGGAINVSAGTTSGNLQTIQFDNANNVTFGLNGSTVTASVAAPGGGAGATYSSTIVGFTGGITNAQLGAGNVYIQPHILQNAVSAVAVKIPVIITNTSSAASSGAWGETWRLGLYTRNATNGTVLTIHYSTSYTISASYSSNVSRAYSVITGIQNSTSYNSVTSSSAGLNLSSNIHGPREFIMPISSLLSAGEYWFALNRTLAVGGTNGNHLSINNYIWTTQTNAPLHVATSATSAGGWAKNIGLGTYSSVQSSLPNGISITQINKIGTQPIFYIVNATS